MNWRLVLALSMFGLAMGIATVFLVPSNVEPIVWLAILVACAVIIARRAPGKYFLHGLCVSLLNSVWITAAHVLLFDSYIARHAREAAMTRGMPLAPRLMMVLTGPVVGLASGLVLGLFAFVAARIIRRPAPVV
jgi:hypothetical protein